MDFKAQIGIMLTDSLSEILLHSKTIIHPNVSSIVDNLNCYYLKLWFEHQQNQGVGLPSDFTLGMQTT